MVVCANCTNEALYTYQISEDYKQNYCDSCLPSFLHQRRDMGTIPLQLPPVEVVVEAAPVKSSKKQAVVEPTPDPVVVDEAPVDATPVAETSAETPATVEAVDSVTE